MVFKIRSYNRASRRNTKSSSEIEDIYEKDKIKGLLKIPSIGKAIATKLEEFITTGKIPYYEQLKIELPVDISQFIGLEGIGPKTIRTIYDNLGIKTISDLEKAVSDGKIRNMSGFSKKEGRSNSKENSIFQKTRRKKTP